MFSGAHLVICAACPRPPLPTPFHLPLSTGKPTSEYWVPSSEYTEYSSMSGPVISNLSRYKIAVARRRVCVDVCQCQSVAGDMMSVRFRIPIHDSRVPVWMIFEVFVRWSHTQVMSNVSRQFGWCGDDDGDDDVGGAGSGGAGLRERWGLDSNWPTAIPIYFQISVWRSRDIECCSVSIDWKSKGNEYGLAWLMDILWFIGYVCNVIYLKKWKLSYASAWNRRCLSFWNFPL